MKKTFLENRLEWTTQAAIKSVDKIFCAFLTAGFPNLQTTEACIWECEKAGVDVLELGFPFSDPLADGPTIQKASEKAIAGGVRVEHAFALIKKMRKQGLKLPVVFFTYLNPVLNYGYEKFVKEAKQSGFDGVLIPDSPPDEEASLQALCHKQGLSFVFLIAPTTPPARARAIAETSSGFIYYVSLRGVTGARAALSQDLYGHLQQVRKLTKKAVLVGFGVSTPDQAKKIAGLSDGVIVGSALIQEIQKPGFTAKKFGAFVARMVRAAKSAR
ncbi:MAG TPA: tryptophan synthase subunit alpha [Candidatus Omnitrophica bacterium]|nr:tryptophan synthase subunit alpha [Candidatus Omnitrophota bacterium]